MAQNSDHGMFMELDDGRVMWWYKDQLLQLEGTSWVPPSRRTTLRMLAESRPLTPEEIKHLEDSGVALPKPSPS